MCNHRVAVHRWSDWVLLPCGNVVGPTSPSVAEHVIVCDIPAVLVAEDLAGRYLGAVEHFDPFRDVRYVEVCFPVTVVCC